MYRQQWQADQQKQIIEKMAGKGPSKSNEEKENLMIEIIITQMEDASVIAKAILAEEDAEDAEEAAVDAVEEGTTIVSI
jgi:predicted DNA-binding ArsR family transcriptional regulator